MNDQPMTLRRFLFEFLTAYALIVAGIVLAGVISERVAPGSRFVYVLCMFAGLIPFLLWLRRCGVLDWDRWDLARVLLLGFGLSIASSWAPAARVYKLLFLGATFVALNCILQLAINRIRGDRQMTTRPS